MTHKGRKTMSRKPAEKVIRRGVLLDAAPVPDRPWAVEIVKRSIRIYCVNDKQRTALWISTAGRHLPSEMAVAKFIVETVNQAAP